MRRFQTPIGILLCALSAVVVFVWTTSVSDAGSIAVRMYAHSRNPAWYNLDSWIGGLTAFQFYRFLIVLYALLGALSFYVIRFFVRIIRYIHNKTKP